MYSLPEGTCSFTPHFGGSNILGKRIDCSQELGGSLGIGIYVIEYMDFCIFMGLRVDNAMIAMDSVPVVHPWSLTWNLKISPWKRRFLLDIVIFRFHVKLGECTTSRCIFFRYTASTFDHEFLLAIGLPCFLQANVFVLAAKYWCFE